MELAFLCDAYILLSIYPKIISYNQLLVFCTTNNSNNFINKYMNNPLIQKENIGLKDYGNLFSNNILNNEQVKQINEIENNNNNNYNFSTNVIGDNSDDKNDNNKFDYNNTLKLQSFKGLKKHENIIQFSCIKNTLNGINDKLNEQNNENNNKNVKRESKSINPSLLNLPKIPSF